MCQSHSELFCPFCGKKENIYLASENNYYCEECGCGFCREDVDFRILADKVGDLLEGTNEHHPLLFPGVAVDSVDSRGVNLLGIPLLNGAYLDHNGNVWFMVYGSCVPMDIDALSMRDLHRVYEKGLLRHYKGASLWDGLYNFFLKIVYFCSCKQ